MPEGSCVAELLKFVRTNKRINGSHAEHEQTKVAMNGRALTDIIAWTLFQSFLHPVY